MKQRSEESKAICRVSTRAATTAAPIAVKADCRGIGRVGREYRAPALAQIRARPGVPLYAGTLGRAGALLRRRPIGARQQSRRARPALRRDAAFIVPLFLKCLEILEVGLPARCDTDDLFAQSRQPPV